MSRERGLLEGARVYLSGPMDFVASREDEMKNGWRNRIGQMLRSQGAIVFDPWTKPEVRGLAEYGREDPESTKAREAWTFEEGPEHAAARARITGKFWETLHIDLRMVDTSDFTIAYCPTNVYSVGTPHEVALCRQQRKPVLFVSPPVEFPALDALRTHLANDAKGAALLAELEAEVPIKPNPRGIPSLWYMPLVGGESFFDGFGFDANDLRSRFGWPVGPLDERERRHPPKRPLLPFLEKLQSELPKKWSTRANGFVRNDDWLLWDLHGKEHGGEVVGPHESK
jgi:hypothetical protein